MTAVLFLYLILSDFYWMYQRSKIDKESIWYMESKINIANQQLNAQKELNRWRMTKIPTAPKKDQQ